MDISNIRWIVLIVVIFGNEIDPATDIPVIDNEIVKWGDVKCNIQLFSISNFKVGETNFQIKMTIFIIFYTENLIWKDDL